MPTAQMYDPAVQFQPFSYKDTYKYRSISMFNKQQLDFTVTLFLFGRQIIQILHAACGHRSCSSLNNSNIKTSMKAQSWSESTWDNRHHSQWLSATPWHKQQHNNKLSQQLRTHCQGLKANSAFYPSGVGKWVPASAGKAKAGMVHSVSGCTRGVQVKLWDPLRTRAIPEWLRGVIMIRRYTNPLLPYLTLLLLCRLRGRQGLSASSLPVREYLTVT